MQQRIVFVSSCSSSFDAMRILLVLCLIVQATWATGDHYQAMGRPTMQQQQRLGVPPSRQRNQQPTTTTQQTTTQQQRPATSQRQLPAARQTQQQVHQSVQVVEVNAAASDKQRATTASQNLMRQDLTEFSGQDYQQQHLAMSAGQQNQQQRMDHAQSDRPSSDGPADGEKMEERQLVVHQNGPPQNRFLFPSKSTLNHAPISQNPLVNVAQNFGASSSSNQVVPGMVVSPSNSPSSATGFQGTFNRIPNQASAQELDLFPLPPAGPKPQILAIDVQCAKESMTVRVEFDQPYNGVIYSKGYFSDPSCRYVSPNSQQTVFEFFIFLNQCGTTFIDQFSTTGHAFLENTLVFQNEAAVQEVWDFARHIRCLWTGLFDKTVTSGINVDMLDVVSVTYSGDTVESYMDIQLGQGPFAQPVTGLVKIGETLTMVIYVLGAENFDIHVKDCIAHDGDIANSIQLTDMRGCVLKKKLMGPWQKTRETGNSGASIIGYSYFQAFRFPDKIEVFFECNIELCKAECQDTCPEYALRKRKKRQAPHEKVSSVLRANKLVEPVRLLRGIRVVAPEDIAISGDGNASVALTTTLGAPNPGDLCMSTPGFVTALVITLLILVVSCFMTAVLCMRVRNHLGDSSSASSPETSGSQTPYAFRDCVGKA